MKITIYIANIVTKYGTDVRVAISKDGLDKQILMFVDEWWNQEMVERGIPIVRPDDATTRDIINMYFGRMGQLEKEWLEENQVEFDIDSMSIFGLVSEVIVAEGLGKEGLIKLEEIIKRESNG